jgi:hypothetical protein
MWSMDDWEYVEREVVADPKGRRWTVALMDVLGQKGDPDVPNEWLQLQYAAGRYFTLIYAAGGGLQWERAYPTLPDATTAYERLVLAVADGRVDPSQPVYREGFDED